MRASELKAGDHFIVPERPEPRAMWRFVADGRAVVVKAGNGKAPFGRRQAHAVGYHTRRFSTWAAQGVELVPMPGPYEVGKDYRTRGGDVFKYVGPSAFRAMGYPHKFAFVGGVRLPCNVGTSPGGCMTTTDAGEQLAGHQEAGDIMGEAFVVVTPALPPPLPLALEVGKRYFRRDGKTTGPLRLSCVPGSLVEDSPYADAGARMYAMDGKHNPPDQRRLNTQCDIIAEAETQMTTQPAKRTLPTFTLDQVFDVLRTQKACWYTDLGPVKLAHTLNSLIPSSGNAQLTIRDLVRLVASTALPRADAMWLISHMSHIKPVDLGIDWGLDWDARISAWENPTPRKPLLSELKPGTRFMLFFTECIKVSGDSWDTIPANRRSTLHVTLKEGNLMWASADCEVDVIDTTTPTKG